MRLAFLSLLFLLPLTSVAASLTISPETQNAAVGEQVTVRVVADTDGTPISAAEGELTYDPAVLEPMLVSTSQSALSMWATEPGVTEPGTILFSGWAGAAVTGAGLPVVTVSFRVLQAGEHDLSLTSGALLSASGSGSNIISNLGRARISALLTTGGQVLGASTEEAPPVPPVFAVVAERAGDRLVISGTSEVGSRVAFTLSSSAGDRTLTANAPGGTFVIIGDRLEAGAYVLTGETYNASGILGPQSAPFEFTVEGASSPLLAAVFSVHPSYLTILVGLLGFVFGFLLYRVLTKRGYLP